MQLTSMNDREIIDQLKVRIVELETAMDELAWSSFNVIKYFAERKI